MPMLGNHSYLLFSDAEDFKHATDDDAEALKAYLDRPSPFSTVVFVAIEPDRRRKVIQLLEKKAQVVEMLPLSRRDAASWVKRYLAKAGVECAPELAEEIAAKFEVSRETRGQSSPGGVNLIWVRTELEKLLTAKPEAKRLERADLELMIGFREEHVIGKLLRAIAAGTVAASHPADATGGLGHQVLLEGFENPTGVSGLADYRGQVVRDRSGVRDATAHRIE